MAHKMCIEDNRGTLISEMHKGVSRGACPFCKIFLNALEFRCILLQPLRREGVSEKRYTIGEMGEPAEEEKEKMEREYSKTYAKKI